MPFVKFLVLNELYILAIKDTRTFSDNENVQCPHCNSYNTFLYTKTFVKRSVVWLKNINHCDVLVYEIVLIPLIKCSNCPSRYRLLPYDMLPRKVYSLSCIIKTCSLYLFNNPTSYRNISLINQAFIHFTTIHGWLGAIGRMFQDLPQFPIVRTCTTAELQQKTADYHPTFFVYLRTYVINIPPQKYKTTERLGELIAAAQFIASAQEYFPKENCVPIVTWYYWLVTKIFSQYTWLFPSRNRARRSNTS